MTGKHILGGDRGVRQASVLLVVAKLPAENKDHRAGKVEGRQGEGTSFARTKIPQRDGQSRQGQPGRVQGDGL